MFAPKIAKRQSKATTSSTNGPAPKRSTPVGYRLGHDPVEQALLLQRTIGNQATLRLLAQQAGSLIGNEYSDQHEQEAEELARKTTGASWDLSKIPPFPPERASRSQRSSPQPGIIQPKLAVDQVDSPLEREADYVADRVMRVLDPDVAIAGTPPQLSRKCAACEEEAQRLQTKSVGSFEASPGEAPGIVHEVLRSPGQSLDPATRAFFEPRFCQDLSQIRVHTDALAAESAHVVNALAYTVGPHIVFGSGQYQPHLDAGRRLLAHELTHSFQQPGLSSAPAVLQRQNAPVQRQPPVPNLCAEAITAITREALLWLDNVNTQLLRYEADEASAVPGAPPGPDHQRIARDLRESFHTDHFSYVSIIRQRLRHVANMLRQPGSVIFTCGGPGCSPSSLNQRLLGYSDRPYALTMCKTNTEAPTDSEVRVFIHEMIHAVVPRVGIRNRVMQETMISDRSYLHERVFRFLSPDEALDNAESYTLLTDRLVNKGTASGVTAPADITRGCVQPNLVTEAFARAEQWNRNAYEWLKAVCNHLRRLARQQRINRPMTVSDLPPEDAALIRRSLPDITSLADLEALKGAFEMLQSSGFHGSTRLGCVTTSPGCRAGELAFSAEGSATATSISQRRIRCRILAQNTVGICPGFLTASLEDRVRSIYAAFLIGRSSRIIADFRLPNKFLYIKFAQEIALHTLPPPAPGSLTHELER